MPTRSSTADLIIKDTMLGGVAGIDAVRMAISLNAYAGHITQASVAEAIGLPYTTANQLLQQWDDLGRIRQRRRQVLFGCTSAARRDKRQS